MKKKVLVLSLLLGAGSMMLTGFDSAATPEDVMAKYTEAAQTASAFSADMDMNLAVGIGVDMDGVSANMDVAILGDLAVDFMKEPLSLKMEGSVSAAIPGEETEDIDMQVYLVPGDEGAWDCFAGINEEGESEWEYTNIPAEQMTEILAMMNGAEFDMTQIPGTLSLGAEAVDVNGVSCYELTNTLTYADLEDVISEALIASGEFGDEEEVQSTLAIVSMAVSDLKLNSIIYVDVDTYLPMKVRIDMNGSDLSALSQILAYSLAQSDDEGNTIFPDITLDISNLYLEATYDYSAPEEIVVPEEGLQAKADSDGDDTLSDLADDVMDEIA